MVDVSMKLKLLTESKYTTYLIKISPTDGRMGHTIETEVNQTTPNPDGTAIKNAVWRYAKKWGIYPWINNGPNKKDLDRINDKSLFTIEIISKGSQTPTLPQNQTKYIKCRSCGQYKPEGPQGDTCKECNQD